jgi:hypothetical protein
VTEYLGWRKSSHSGGGDNNCVEVAVANETIGVRDSKSQQGPIMEFPKNQWRAFLDAQKAEYHS